MVILFTSMERLSWAAIGLTSMICDLKFPPFYHLSNDPEGAKRGHIWLKYLFASVANTGEKKWGFFEGCLASRTTVRLGTPRAAEFETPPFSNHRLSDEPKERARKAKTRDESSRERVSESHEYRPNRRDKLPLLFVLAFNMQGREETHTSSYSPPASMDLHMPQSFSYYRLAPLVRSFGCLLGLIDCGGIFTSSKCSRICDTHWFFNWKWSLLDHMCCRSFVFAIHPSFDLWFRSSCIMENNAVFSGQPMAYTKVYGSLENCGR